MNFSQLLNNLWRVLLYRSITPHEQRYFESQFKFKGADEGLKSCLDKLVDEYEEFLVRNYKNPYEFLRKPSILELKDQARFVFYTFQRAVE